MTSAASALVDTEEGVVGDGADGRRVKSGNRGTQNERFKLALQVCEIGLRQSEWWWSVEKEILSEQVTNNGGSVGNNGNNNNSGVGNAVGGDAQKTGNDQRRFTGPSMNSLAPIAPMLSLDNHREKNLVGFSLEEGIEYLNLRLLQCRRVCGPAQALPPDLHDASKALLLLNEQAYEEFYPEYYYEGVRRTSMGSGRMGGFFGGGGGGSGSGGVVPGGGIDGRSKLKKHKNRFGDALSVLSSGRISSIAHSTMKPKTLAKSIARSMLSVRAPAMKWKNHHHQQQQQQNDEEPQANEEQQQRPASKPTKKQFIAGKLKTVKQQFNKKSKKQKNSETKGRRDSADREHSARHEASEDEDFYEEDENHVSIEEDGRRGRARARGGVEIQIQIETETDTDTDTNTDTEKRARTKRSTRVPIPALVTTRDVESDSSAFSPNSNTHNRTHDEDESGYSYAENDGKDEDEDEDEDEYSSESSSSASVTGVAGPEATKRVNSKKKHSSGKTKAEIAKQKSKKAKELFKKKTSGKQKNKQDSQINGDDDYEDELDKNRKKPEETEPQHTIKPVAVGYYQPPSKQSSKQIPVLITAPSGSVAYFNRQEDLSNVFLHDKRRLHHNPTQQQQQHQQQHQQQQRMMLINTINTVNGKQNTSAVDRIGTASPSSINHNALAIAGRVSGLYQRDSFHSRREDALKNLINKREDQTPGISPTDGPGNTSQSKFPSSSSAQGEQGKEKEKGKRNEHEELEQETPLIVATTTSNSPYTNVYFKLTVTRLGRIRTVANELLSRIWLLSAECFLQLGR
ncbi:hypothetical protein AX774_g5627, partial [Zancudomyces culisetae]